jgi:hypothetical protein
MCSSSRPRLYTKSGCGTLGKSCNTLYNNPWITIINVIVQKVLQCHVPGNKNIPLAAHHKGYALTSSPCCHCSGILKEYPNIILDLLAQSQAPAIDFWAGQLAQEVRTSEAAPHRSTRGPPRRRFVCQDMQHVSALLDRVV